MDKDNITEYDELLLSRTRLGILSALVGGDEIDFTQLRNELELSDGNLSVQIRKLEEAGYIKVSKEFADRRPRTFCKITAKGRGAMLKLIRHLEGLVERG